MFPVTSSWRQLSPKPKETDVKVHLDPSNVLLIGPQNVLKKF